VKIGPWGGAGGDERNVQAMPRRLVSVTIHSAEGIDGISFTYVGSDYVQYTEGPWGRTLNTESTVREINFFFPLLASLSTSAIVLFHPLPPNG
jgi:hypothetical protein